MNSCHQPGKRRLQHRLLNQQQGMTLAEMIVAMAIFSIVTIGLAYAFMFGARMDQITQSKLGASDQSRRGFGLFSTDVRSAKIWGVGNCVVATNGTLSSYTAIPNGTGQQGTAIKISLTTDTNIYICYYYWTNKGKLLRVKSSNLSDYDVIAQYLTNGVAASNTMFFRNEDYRENLTTVQTHKGVVATTMQFSQYQYPLTRIGHGFYYDFYRLTFKLTPHVPDGP